jgi:DNA-directed RNA polymerase specialized sigma24 family protein
MYATVRSALEDLPREMRIALLMRERQGLSYEEIARDMDVPASTARRLVFQARTAIDDRLRATQPREPGSEAARPARAAAPAEP